MPRKLFYELTKIPHGSKNEKALVDWIVSLIKPKGYLFWRDELDNLVVYKPASPGYEGHPVVMLQAHTDMVNEKTITSSHDFQKDALTLIEKEGVLCAKETTLGADDGVGVAYILAILLDDQLQHPALECVFTVQEEIGLIGAKYLDKSNLKAQYMIGLDSSMDDTTCVSSSGGVRFLIEKQIVKKQVLPHRLTLMISGLSGGHSGEAIIYDKANAIKLAGQVLKYFPNLRLSKIVGGDKVNAIAREVVLEFGLRDQTEFFKEKMMDCEQFLQTLYPESEKGICLDYEVSEVDTFVLDYQDQIDLTNFLILAPYGVTHRSLSVVDHPLSSNNLGVISFDENKISVLGSIRSPYPEMIDEISEKFLTLCQLTGFKMTFNDQYPGWMFDEGSYLRKCLLDTNLELYGKTLTLQAVHGGLELGLFKEAMPWLDIIAIGPNMWDIHTPNERLDLASFDRVYHLLVTLISRL